MELLQMVGYPLLLTGVVVLVATSWRWKQLWALRRVPGSPGTWVPLLGDLLQVAQKDLTFYIDELYPKYPRAFKLWMGPHPWVVITDIELARRLLMRYTERFDISFMVARKPEHTEAVKANQVFVNGNTWRVMRRASESVVMHAKSLAAQVPFVSQCTRLLVQHLDRYASSGEPLDMQAALYTMAMDAIGYAAFGVDLKASQSLMPSGGGGDATADISVVGLGQKGQEGAHAESTLPAPASEDQWWHKYPVGSDGFGRNLISCVQGLQQEADPANASAYSPLVMLFPELRPLLLWMASHYPDDKLRRIEKEHEGLYHGSATIIEAWKQQQRQQTAAPVSVSSTAGPAAAQGPASIAANGAVSDTGLLARVLSEDSYAQQRTTLNQVELVGLTTGTLFAGFETTGTTIAMCLYHLATQPEAQARAQQEVDTVLQGKDPVMEDLEQLPYITAVFNETLRLHPPGAAAIRQVSDPVMDLGNGITVPKGTSLLLPLHSYMRDPKVWPRASEWLPERHLPGHDDLQPSVAGAFIPFGHGSRLCVGYKFATLEARMAVARLMQRFTFHTVRGAPPPHIRTSVTTKPDKVVLSITRRVQ